MITQQRPGFARGLHTCVEMLEKMDIDECIIVGLSAADLRDLRDGRPQDNAVRRTLGQVLMRGDPDELEGFCAALTDIVATAGENDGYSSALPALANRVERGGAHG